MRDRRDFKRLGLGEYFYRGYRLIRYRTPSGKERWRCRMAVVDMSPISGSFYSRAKLAAHIDDVLAAPAPVPSESEKGQG